jgi:guanylate kinase
MGKIFTFSGPRGVGKTSVMDDLHERCGVAPIVPYTTRDPRPNEVEGKDYHFVTDYEFDAIRRTRGMFDVLTLRDRKYGTPLEEFDRVVGGPSDSVEHIRTINLAASSALELRKEIGVSSVRSLFILPECWDDIEQQMRDKGIPEEQIRERRSAEPTDLTMLPEFDRIIVNGYGNREAAFRNAASYITQITGVGLPGVVA